MAWSNDPFFAFVINPLWHHCETYLMNHIDNGKNMLIMSIKNVMMNHFFVLLVNIGGGQVYHLSSFTCC